MDVVEPVEPEELSAAEVVSPSEVESEPSIPVEAGGAEEEDGGVVAEPVVPGVVLPGDVLEMSPVEVGPPVLPASAGLLGSLQAPAKNEPRHNIETAGSQRMREP